MSWLRTTMLVAIGIAATATLANARADQTAALPSEVTVNGVEFVLIPAGWFFKSGGIPVTDPSGETRTDGGEARLWLDDYYIGKYEARARDLRRFLNDGNPRMADAYGGDKMGCALRRDTAGGYFEVAPEADLPATHVSWLLADEWSRWMGFRLPTESEWEKAARGGDHRVYPWGNDEPDETFANFGTTSDCLVWPVNSAEKGKSPYGVYNMTGNVRELIADAFNPAADKRYVDGFRNPAVVPDGERLPGQKHSLKLVKGGRWASLGQELMIATRVKARADDPFQCNGTRFALDAAVVRRLLSAGSATMVRQ